MARDDEPNGLTRHERDLWVSLKYHLEALMGERQRLIEMQFREHDKQHAQDKESIKTALAANDRRLDTMNEFRKALEDMAAQSVRRELFDIVANRLTVVENTYLTRVDYANDKESEQKRDVESTRIREAAYKSDHDQIAAKVSALERTIIGREVFGNLNEKVVNLEKTAVSQETLNSQHAEQERSRRATTLALIAVGAAAVLNFVVNIYQGAHGN